jgi:hypothetical protein
MGIFAFIGQILIYRMTEKRLDQNLIALIVTTRKIETVGLSIMYFYHQTNWGQIVAILILFLATFYEYIVALSNNKSQKYQRKEKF